MPPEELFEYQKVGAAFLRSKKVALLADSMGLGKSAQAISALKPTESVIVVCPAVARVNWLREFEKFSPVKRDFQIVRDRKAAVKADRSVIVSYDAICSNPFGWQGRWGTLILDEVHYCKNLAAKRSKMIFGWKGLVRNVDRVWALSATPAPNDISELWILLYSFGVTALGFDQFIERYCRTVQTAFGKKITGNKSETINELKTMLDRIMLRRKVEDVMKELPPISYHSVDVEPGPVDIELCPSLLHYLYPSDNRAELAALLRQQQDYVIKTVEMNAGLNRAAMGILEGMAKSISTLRKYNGLQKVAPALDLVIPELQAGAYDKLVVFAIHTDVIRHLWEGFHKAKIRAVTLFGGTPAGKRQRHIDDFQKDPKVKVFIGQIQAAGVAITLTAAHEVLFVEQSWTPGDNAQAAMRCRRIGQTKPVRVRVVGIDGSIDGQIAKTLKTKMKNLNELFEENPLQPAEVDAFS